MSINNIKYNKINEIVLKLAILANSYYGKHLGNSPLKGKSREKTPVHAKKVNSFSLDAYENTSSVSFSTPIRTRYFFLIGSRSAYADPHQSSIGIKVNK